jgi:hypothetical protein
MAIHASRAEDVSGAIMRCGPHGRLAEAWGLHMSLVILKTVLLWSFAINYGLLLLWFILIAVAHDPLYRLCARWFRISVQTFDAVNYGGISAYKICILFFTLVPWLALSLAT